MTTARKIPKNANEFIEQQLDERLNSLADAFQSDALTFYGSLIVGADDAIRIEQHFPGEFGYLSRPQAGLY